MKAFTVISSNPNKTGGFVTKLQTETIVSDEIFGDKKAKLTYYISGSLQVPIGKIIPEAVISKYAVQEHSMLNPETGETFMGKWLHARA